MWRKRIQLTMIHAAVAITLVPITSTLNRVMIKELGISAALVAALVSFPYLLSPLQMAIGSYADRHPIWGRRRLPYIMFGLVLCIFGAILAPSAAYAFAGSWQGGLLLGALAFGAWGIGFNLASVAYFSLASELTDPAGRGTTTAVMFFGMILAIIVTAITVGRIVDPYTPEALYRAFGVACAMAAVLGGLGLIRLEQPITAASVSSERHTLNEIMKAVLDNPQARLFFVYLFLLLAAILGQDVLLEPYAGEAFNLSVSVTTRITSIWGTCVLLTIAIAGFLQSRLSKKVVAQWGGWGAAAGFALITGSGLIASQPVFYTGVVLLGLGTGLATVSNVSLMLDMTAAERVGLFIGAWGMAQAFSRLAGSMLGGVVRDVATAALGSKALGYVIVFAIETLMLVVSLALLGRIDTTAFQKRVEAVSPLDAAALMGESQV